MKIGNDEVKLVESFDELGLGMLVWMVGCPLCATNHRTMLMRLESGLVGWSVGRGLEQMDGWRIDPDHNCNGRFGGSAISPRTVAAGRVYRVVDPLADRELWRNQGRRLYNGDPVFNRLAEKAVEEVRKMFVPAKEGR